MEFDCKEMGDDERAAWTMAGGLHAEQKYGDKPYLYHLRAVREIMVEFGFEGDLLTAAWLHDALEDTPCTPERIEMVFGPAVTHLVWAVTGVGKNRKERNECIYERLAERPAALPLKLGDRIANAEASAAGNPKLLEMYRKEYPEFRSRLHRLTPFVGDDMGPVVERMWTRLDKVLG